MEAVRVDKWLWSVRIFSTRSQATTACAAGHVQVNGRNAKASTLVRVNDSVNAYSKEVHRVLSVERLIDKRVGAAVAVLCYCDHTPQSAEPVREMQVGKRLPGAGRPTKKDRRQLDKFRQKSR
ncbi:MAG: S4 domain-containing protein [Microthrixaceae bacterium]